MTIQELENKWNHKVGENWYGFALPDDCPKSWYSKIDELLTDIHSKDPDFEILQIKLKFGALRFYIDSKFITTFYDKINELERFCVTDNWI